MATIRQRMRKASLTANFKEVGDVIRKDMVDHFADAVEVAFTEIVVGTPKDTGYARYHWEILHEGVQAKPPADPAGKRAGVQYPGVSEIVAHNKDFFTYLRRSNFENNFRFFNNAPYIGMLEKGYSSQNRDFTKRALVRLRAALKQSMKKRRSVKKK